MTFDADRYTPPFLPPEAVHPAQSIHLRAPTFVPAGPLPGHILAVTTPSHFRPRVHVLSAPGNSVTLWVGARAHPCFPARPSCLHLHLRSRAVALPPLCTGSILRALNGVDMGGNGPRATWLDKLEPGASLDGWRAYRQRLLPSVTVAFSPEF